MRFIRSIGMNLHDVFEHETLIIDLLKKCKKKANGGFKVFLFHNGILETELENFVTRNNGEFMQTNIEITDDFDNSVFFLITKNGTPDVNYRYKVVGSVESGINHYLRLMQHISTSRYNR